MTHGSKVNDGATENWVHLFSGSRIQFRSSTAHTVAIYYENLWHITLSIALIFQCCQYHRCEHCWFNSNALQMQIPSRLVSLVLQWPFEIEKKESDCHSLQVSQPTHSSAQKAGYGLSNGKSSRSNQMYLAYSYPNPVWNERIQFALTRWLKCNMIDFVAFTFVTSHHKKLIRNMFRS